MPFQNTLITRLSSAEKCDHFSFMSATLRKCLYFLRTYLNIIKVLTMGYAQFLILITGLHMPFQNTLISRLSSAEKWDHFSFMSATLTKTSYPYKIFLLITRLFGKNICEYYQGSSNARSTVFVLVTDFLMPFENTLICRLSSAKKSYHFSFMSATLRKSSYFLRTYVKFINYQGSKQCAKHSFCFD